MLEEAQSEGRLKDDLARLLREKNPAQYLEDWAGDSALADDALARAGRLVGAAEEAFRQAERDGWPGVQQSENPVAAELLGPGVERTHADGCERLPQDGESTSNGRA